MTLWPVACFVRVKQMSTVKAIELQVCAFVEVPCVLSLVIVISVDQRVSLHDGICACVAKQALTKVVSVRAGTAFPD